MPNKYYYLVASLPHLKFGEKPPITRESFLSECAKWLDEKSLGRVASASIDDFEIKEGEADVVKSWKSFDRGLRGELAAVRQARKEGARERIPLGLKDVFEERNPLFMEKKIELRRWDFLEEEELDRHFDLNVLFLYFLRLQILERLASFDKEKGKGLFERLSEVRS